jgi:transposase
VRRRDRDSSRPLCRRRRKKGDPAEPHDHALGRSRGGFSTKIHLFCDANGCPIHFELSLGQAHENTSLVDLLNGIDDELTTGTGDQVPWPVAIAGDKGYRADWIDAMLVDMGITPVIPSKKNEDRDHRAVAFDQQRYRQRNIVERLIGWLKECRCVFARYEKTAINYAGMIRMAFIQRYLKIIAP